MPSDGTYSTGVLGRLQNHAAIDYLADGATAQRGERQIVHAMVNALRIYSDWGADHSVRVGVFMRRFAEALGYSIRDSSQFGLCACLHDMGKLSIPSEIIEKPGPLTASERAIVELHTTNGVDCLNFLEFKNHHLVDDMIQSHHENFDGTGYPDRLVGNTISDINQMGRLCDFFDAVCFDRPYRKGLGRIGAVRFMSDFSNCFNPKLQDVFFREINTIVAIPDFASG